MKDDPLGKLKWCVQLWAQREKWMKMYIIIFSLHFVYFICRTQFILQSTNDVDVFLEISVAYPILVLATAKLGFLLFQRNKIRYLFSAVTDEFWDIGIAGNVVKNQLEKRFKFINFLVSGYFSGGCLSVIFIMTFSYVPLPEGRTRRLPTLILFPLNQDKSPVYEFLYLFLTWNVALAMVSNALFDMTFIYASQHLCGQFVLLKQLLKKLEFGLMQNLEEVEDVKNYNSSAFQKQIHKRIKMYVRHHNRLLSYGNVTKWFASTIFGLQLIINLITLVLMGYDLTEHFDQLRKSAVIFTIGGTCVAQFILFAVISSEIHHQSSSVADAVYLSKWYLFKPSSKRALSFIIMNAQKGIVMYAAGLVPINNEIIVAMGQKVFSCITLLKSMRK